MATFDEDSDQTGYNEYDKKFTEDISKKMQIPDKLVPVNDNESTSFNLRDNQANATQPSSQCWKLYRNILIIVFYSLYLENNYHFHNSKL